MAEIKHEPPAVEISRVLAAEWDIAAMQKYIAERDIEPSNAVVSFDSMLGFFGEEMPEGPGTWRIGMFHVDKERAMSDQIDPTIPIIIADITGADGEIIGRVPLDGRHRLYKAWKTATSDPVMIPFHFISGPEELKFRTWRSVKPEPKRKKRARKAR